jgi:hypothetical protein
MLACQVRKACVYGSGILIMQVFGISIPGVRELLLA